MEAVKQCTKCGGSNIEKGINTDDMDELVLNDDGTGTFQQDWHCKDCDASGVSVWKMELIEIKTDE